jgi:hypothetical protein
MQLICYSFPSLIPATLVTIQHTAHSQNDGVLIDLEHTVNIVKLWDRAIVLASHN